MPPGTSAVSPWLLEAPPWRESNTLQGAVSTTGTKRQWTAISDAERDLGKLARATALDLRRSGWRNLVEQVRGRSNISPEVEKIPHRAARLLNHLRRRGASVLTATTPWSATRCDHAMVRGPHKSATLETAFVCTEIMDFCSQGYWVVLPYDDVRHWPTLRISPLGVVPQRDRRPRLIVDYTFSNVNEDTVPLAPKESMQFGRALQRIMAKIVRADPRYGPVRLAKIDIADGFYRVWLQIADKPKLEVVLPSTAGQPRLVAFPLALPMGWIESPLFHRPHRNGLRPR